MKGKSLRGEAAGVRLDCQVGDDGASELVTGRIAPQVCCAHLSCGGTLRYKGTRHVSVHMHTHVQFTPRCLCDKW